MATPLYPVDAPINGINQGLFPFKVNAEFFKEWIQVTPFWNLMGTEMTRPIVRKKMGPGEGFQYRVPKLNALDYTKPVINFDQVSGAGQYQKVDSDSITCRGLSFPVPIKNHQLLSLGTPINLLNSVRPQLIEVCQRNFNKCILDSAMFDFLDVTNVGKQAGYAPATTMPSYDRVVLAGLATTRATYNGYAGITTAWNSFTAGDAGALYSAGGLSGKHLLKLKAMASRGGNTDGAVLTNGSIEDAIRPAFMKTKRGFPLNEYIYFCTTESIATLSLDPMFNQSTINRGTVVDPDQPQAISGADYYGKFYGIHIYEIKDLSNYISLSQDGNKRVAWELFIGAGAFSAGWFEEPTVVFKEDVINRTMEFTTHETRGEKALKFPAKQASTLGIANTGGVVEQGIIHSFVRV